MGLGTALPSTHFTDVETEAWRAGLSFCPGQAGRQAGASGSDPGFLVFTLLLPKSDQGPTLLPWGSHRA